MATPGVDDASGVQQTTVFALLGCLTLAGSPSHAQSLMCIFRIYERLAFTFYARCTRNCLTITIGGTVVSMSDLEPKHNTHSTAGCTTRISSFRYGA
uniref:Putative secreted protein n=1 Tax=Anopheles marajoara TaxID=58244 RepID=A0A2M4C966_9DIPT